MDDLARMLEDLGIVEHVVQLGYVDDVSLRWLYQNCFACCYVSLFEGSAFLSWKR
jgi:hypothetical protein